MFTLVLQCCDVTVYVNSVVTVVLSVRPPLNRLSESQSLPIYGRSDARQVVVLVQLLPKNSATGLRRLRICMPWPHFKTAPTTTTNL